MQSNLVGEAQHPNAACGVGVGIGGGQSRGDAGQIGPGLLDGDAVTQTSETDDRSPDDGRPPPLA